MIPPSAADQPRRQPNRAGAEPAQAPARLDVPEVSGQHQIGYLVGGRYELIKPIASGGMARVWEGRDTVLNRPVAVKVLHPHLATDRGFLLRFRREAIAAARLSHRSIVAIYDTVTEPATTSNAGVANAGIEAIVMELIDGDTLRTTLDQVGKLSPTDVVQLGRQIADALDAAHRAGIVHRDIKPSNILFCSDRRIMVTDFGIAKAGEDTDLTVTGTLLGTAKYLAPEQVNGDLVDPRADLYALGIVLFEALTGQAPFQADTDAATALARLHQSPPRASQFQPDVPSDLDAIIHRLMARSPDERQSSASELSSALSGVRPEYIHPDHTLVLADHEPGELDTDFEDEEEYEEGFLRSERSWMVPAMALVLVAAGLLVAGVLIASNLGQSVIDSPGVDDSEQTTSEITTPAAEPGTDDPEPSNNTTVLSPGEVIDVDASIVGARAIDFEGDGEEHDDRVGLAFDGDDDTAWTTDTYHGELFGRLKTGVGYLIDMGGTATVSEVRMETNSRHWSISFYLMDEFVEDKTADKSGWGEPIAIANNESGNERIRMEGTGRWLLLWITDPGTSDDGSDEDEEDDHRFELAELEVS